MNLDWLTNLLPVINATGIPLLAMGIILLLRAYQKSVETYKETSSHLREENERLRKRLAEADTVYFSEVEKMRAMVASSVEAIKELQARKIALLSKPDDATNEAILTDVKKINEAIKWLQEISSIAKKIDLNVRESLFYLSRDFQELTIQASELADQISDTKSRVAIVGVVTSSKAIEELKAEIQNQGQKRGLVAPPPEEKPKLVAAQESEKIDLEDKKHPELDQPSA